MKSNKEEIKGDNPEKLKVSEDGQLKIWHWNVNGVRAVLRDNTFQTLCNKGKSISDWYLTKSDRYSQPLNLMSK